MVHCNKDIKNYLLPNGTKVRLSDGTVGIVDGNDSETTEEYENINYYVCPLEFTNLDVWSNHYKMALLSAIEVIE